ncbi:MAG: hypothetical protein R3D98_04200 [Candidatus Krumholzibacteriia bacterium]
MRRWLAPFLALAGVAPVRTWALRRALRAEARGQLVLQYEERGRRGMHPDTGRILLLVLLALLSIGVAAGVAFLRGRPDLAVSLLVFAQGGAVLMRSAGEVAPLVLGSDDRRVLGWWPVSERELLVARGLLILETVLEASAAMLAVPLVVLLVVGAPPAVPALGALVGLALHAICLAATMLLAVHGLGRLLGRQRARRVVEVLGSISLVIVINVTMRALRPLLGQLDGLSAWFLVLVPTYWFGAWGALAQPTWIRALAAALALVTTAGLAVGGVRVLGRGREAADADPTVRRSQPRDWTGPVIGWLAPWLPGRAGRAMALLLQAHLREDWRFTGALLFLPAALLVYLLVIRIDDLGDLQRDLHDVPTLVSTFSLWMSFLALSLGGAITCSVESQASWLLNGGVLDGRGILALQRRAIRWLIPLPLLVVLGGLLMWRAGLGPLEAALVIVPAWLTFESLLVFLQATAPSAPFSRAWSREGQGFRGFHLLLIMVWPLATLPAMLGYRHPPWGVAVALGGQLVVLGLLRLLLQWRVGRLGVFGLDPRP